MADFIEFKMVGGDKFLMDVSAWGAGIRQQAQAAASEAAARVVTYASRDYHRGPTGNLKRGVKVVSGQGAAGGAVLARARSGARHAHLYEWGTARRRTATGANRGVMPRRPTFVPIAIQERARFITLLQQILDKPVVI